MKHVLGFSGGVDSQATALWMRRNLPVEDIILVNADPGGNESPLTTDFIAWYSDNVHPVVVVKPQVQDMFGRAEDKIAELGLKPTDELTFPLMAEIKEFWPSSKIQFCTDHLKLYPMRRWSYENGAARLNESILGPRDNKRRPYDGPAQREGILSGGFERYAGVRRSESEKRAAVSDREFDDLFMRWLNRPIAAWTKEQCFRYLADAGEPWNPLYQMGFLRVGCFPCVNQKKEEIRLWAAMFPEQVRKIREWESRLGRPFFKAKISEKQGKVGWIDEVIAWANTAHGGKEPIFDFAVLDAQAGLCSNKYGFCE